MAWEPMNDVLQFVDADGDPCSGYVLKAYEAGTTTNKSMATDSGGGGLQASITLNAEGKPEVSGNEVIPYIDSIHKWALFTNQTDADANSNPYAGFYDNVPITSVSTVASNFSTPTTYAGTARSMTSADIGYYIQCTNTAAVVITIDSSAGFTAGDEVVWYYPVGTGTVTLTFATSGGMTLQDNRTVTPGKTAGIKYLGNDTFSYTGP